MKFSIIIPVYGVEKYIADCIHSCIDNIGPSSSEVEVIVVDDGSKDRSIEIVRSIVADIPYFSIITQENQGLSMARNNGLEVAKGDYVWFVDSDDIIPIGIVNRIIKAVNCLEGIDIFELHYQKVDEKVDRSKLPTIESYAESYTETKGRDRLRMGFDPPVPFHVFRRSFLNENELRMYPGIYHEDSEFTPRAEWLAQHVVDLPEIAYYYRQRGCSIMTTSNPQKGENYIFVANRLKEFFDGQIADESERKAINNYIAMIYCNGLHNVIGTKGDDRSRIVKAAYQNRCVLTCLKGATQYKYRLLGVLGSIAPKYIADIYQFMMKFNNKY